MVSSGRKHGSRPVGLTHLLLLCRCHSLRSMTVVRFWQTYVRWRNTSRLHTPGRDVPQPSFGRGSHRGRNRQERMGREFFGVPRAPPVTVLCSTYSSLEASLLVPQPPLEGPGDGDLIRSVGQLVRFVPRWSDAPSLPATTVFTGKQWFSLDVGV